MKMSLKPNDCNFAHGMVCSSVYLKYVGDAAKLRAGEKKYYFKFCMGLDIDSEKEGNKTRYINHSTNPNLCQQYIYVNGEKKIAFYAIRDIYAQEELLFDYGDDYTFDTN